MLWRQIPIPIGLKCVMQAALIDREGGMQAALIGIQQCLQGHAWENTVLDIAVLQRWGADVKVMTDCAAENVAFQQSCERSWGSGLRWLSPRPLRA